MKGVLILCEAHAVSTRIREMSLKPSSTDLNEFSPFVIYMTFMPDPSYVITDQDTCDATLGTEGHDGPLVAYRLQRVDTRVKAN